MHTVKQYLYNLRPYSWGDLVLLGYLAKVSVYRVLAFEWRDVFLIAPLLCLWFFYNLALEAKHNYTYRGKISFLPAIVCLAAALVISFRGWYGSILWLFFSTLLVLLYMYKGRYPLIGKTSFIIRGGIQASYFFYAASFAINRFTPALVVLGILVFLLCSARSLLGDMRDIKHNKEAKKLTFPVAYGMKRARFAAFGLSLVASSIQLIYFESVSIAVPLALFTLSPAFYRNWYVLHQLSIITTLFFSAGMIAWFTGQSVWFVNLMYTGIYLNLIFYPLLKRKSNPRFVDNKFALKLLNK